MLEVKQLETNDTINIVNNAWSQTIIVWLQALFTMFIVSLVSNCLTSMVFCVMDDNTTLYQKINQWYNKHCK
jgi:hypothetical protein